METIKRFCLSNGTIEMQPSQIEQPSQCYSCNCGNAFACRVSLGRLTSKEKEVAIKLSNHYKFYPNPWNKDLADAWKLERKEMQDFLSDNANRIAYES